ncbi:MAG: hypothetical protein NTU74_05630 [Deltaproteobacteria bacterium]|nr:hypothetical protein [Deltaproteobacteria bacterium]
MGKTSTTKASKKKTVAKKKETAKKVKADPTASGQNADLKTEETQVTVELKGSKESAKAGKAGIPIQKKPILLSELILKKFDAWQPDNLFVPLPDKSIIPDAPPFVSGKDDQEVGRKRALLFNTFDMKAIIAEGERFAAEKAKAERIAAEKAEAERIATEKKAEAERIAAEKAEAERIAAEKAAAEKAEAERIAAEKKAEAERIAAEKAAATLERKKAIELQQASTPKVKITYDQPAQPAQPVQPALPAKDADPMDISIKIAAGCLAFLVLILLGTSLCNSQKFYIKTAKNGIEIWQGRFAPLGEKQLISLAGVKAPEKVKKVYSDLDVYPIIFSYFLNKADAILDDPGIPDFEDMKYYINLAEPYAMTRELRDAADLRLNSMAKTLLIYKAEIAASRGNIADLEAAVDFLYKAKALNLDKAQAESLDKKINAATGRLEQLKAQPQAAATTKTK